MAVVGRLNQYASMQAAEFDEITGGNTRITGFGTYIASEFSENVGIGTTLTANVFPPYDPVYDEFGGTFFGAGQGRYMRQYTDKSVIVYNEIDEITDLFGRGIVRDGLVLDLDAGISASYAGIGTIWTDLSVYGNNGTLTNGPTYNSSNGGSIVFDGSSSYVSCGSVSSNLSSGVSFQLIFKSSDITSRQQGLLIYQAGTIGNPYINLWCPGDGRVRWETYTSTSPNVGTSIFSSNLSNNVWYHIIGTYSSNGTNATVRVYVNGVENTSSTISAPNFSNLYNYTLEIGRYQNFGVLLGNIATAQIYNRALTATEISQNYNALKHRFGL